MPDLHHHNNVHLLGKANEIHASEFIARFAPLDIIVDVDDTIFLCFSSASGNKLATITLLVNPTFAFGAAFVTFVALCALPVFISGPLTRCFTFS